jgi:hypothetical protein
MYVLGMANYISMCLEMCDFELGCRLCHPLPAGSGNFKLCGTIFHMGPALELKFKTYNQIVLFLFWGSASYCRYFIKVIRRIIPRNNSLRCLFYILYIFAMATLK